MKELIRKLKVIDKNDKAIGETGFSASRNIIFAIVKITLAIISQSLWFLANGVFYILIAVTRVISVKDYLKIRKIDDENIKQKICEKNYYHNGLLLVFLGLSYLGVSIIMYKQKTTTIFTDLWVYTVATVAFWNLGVSIYGMIKYKGNQNLIIKGTKITNYAGSLVSIVTTQIVLINEFYKGTDSMINQYNGLVGMIVSLVIVLTGAYMIIKIKREEDDRNDINIDS